MDKNKICRKTILLEDVVGLISHFFFIFTWHRKSQ